MESLRTKESAVVVTVTHQAKISEDGSRSPNREIQRYSRRGKLTSGRIGPNRALDQ